MSENEINIDEEILEAILERPYGFTVKDKRFYLYPVTLGKSILLSRLMRNLEIDTELLAKNPSIETLRVVSVHRDVAILIIAYCTAKDRQEVFDNARTEEYKRLLSKNLKQEFDKLTFKETLTYGLAIASLIAGFTLLFFGMFLPPEGQIHESVLTAFGIILVFVGAILGIEMHYADKTKKFMEQISQQVTEALNKNNGKH
ncbi:MAG: hypothetical protein NC095_06265 [Muribaculum sp.]|nr:hypothetical protein [Muribaculum sp.]